MSDDQGQAVLEALREVCKRFEEEEYTNKNLRDRMRGAHLLAMRLVGIPWPLKGEAIRQDWWKTLRTP